MSEQEINNLIGTKIKKYSRIGFKIGTNYYLGFIKEINITIIIDNATGLVLDAKEGYDRYFMNKSKVINK